MVAALFFVLVLGAAAGLELRNGAYEDFVVRVSETIPQEDCRTVLDNLQVTLTSASQYLFSALNGRAYLRTATVLLPPAWSDSCVEGQVVSGAGEASDMTVLPRDPIRGRIYTQQSLGCGQAGDQIYITHESLMERDTTLARTFVKEFAMYRYGVFEEQGYFSDPIYPMCFYDGQSTDAKATGCSDLPINDNGMCTPNTPITNYNTTRMLDVNARSSIMFAPESPEVSIFCDDGNHDRYAPTKHNSMCHRQSVLTIIEKHNDFTANGSSNSDSSSQLTDTTPTIIYKRQNLTRYVFVLENTKDMMQRDSWSYLRLAMRYWALNIVPQNTEVGMVLAEESAKRVANIVSFENTNSYENSNRDRFYSAIPYTPGDSIQPGCLHCALKEAVEMLNEKSSTQGGAKNVIVMIAAGFEPSPQMDKVLDEVKKSKIQIAAVNFPKIIRSQLLNRLAEETNGVAYTVFEHKLNSGTTLLSTYFEVRNVLYDIVQRFYSGSEADLPIEIHRRKITADGRTSVTGSFMLEPNMGKPSQFTLLTHNSEIPLISNPVLISPSHRTFSNRNDRFIDFKMIGLTANISESGSWTYTVEPYPGNPQPHFLQVTATPSSALTPVVKAKFWTHKTPEGSLILLVEVKKGDIPVMGASVEVTVTKYELNGTHLLENRFALLDTGSGDPDITKGDGVYTRYFSAAETGPGLYTFEVIVNDNGNTAYTWTETAQFDDSKPCCGSTIVSSAVTPIAPFERFPAKITHLITSEDIASEASAGRIGDLKSTIIPEDMKARLTWTSPDLGGRTVSRYEIKYASSVNDITDGFETIATAWDQGQPFPLAPGSETTFTLDLAQKKELLDKPFYFAIKAFPKLTMDAMVEAQISNWVRVIVPSPPPPPTVPPTYSSNDQSYWPNNVNSVDPIGPSISKSMGGMGLELILPIAIGFILLVVLLVLYCYFCVMKRRDHRSGDTHKKSNSPMKNDRLSSTITIVPSTPQNMSQAQTNYGADFIPDPHQIGVPINYDYEEETKKRYSLVNQQEQQLIEELKQQQHMVRDMGTPNNGYSGLSVISNGTLNRNGHTLSPYNSWSASQLLHEHERRHSPMEHMDEQMNVQELLISPNHEHYHNPPPVPPLPAFSPNGYPANYNIYGVHPGNHPIYQSMQRSDGMVPFNASLQGSMSSVNSGDKKRRNVTMV